MPGNNSLRRAFWLFIIGLSVFVVYSNALFMDFVWDDYVVRDAKVRKSFSDIPYFFSSSLTSDLRADNISPYYRPVGRVFAVINYSLSKDRPFGYHLTNIALHILNSFLVFFLALKLIKSEPAAVFAGLLFAVHPVHSEAVAYISGSGDPLCSGFMLLSFYLYIVFREKSRRSYLLLSAAFYFLALLCKEMAITLPLLIVLYELILMKSGMKKAVLHSLLFAGITVIYMIMRMRILVIGTWEDPPLLIRIYTGLGLITHYLRLLVAPVDLRVFYDIPIQWNFIASGVIVPLLAIIGILAGLRILAKYDPRPAFALLWILVTLFPVSGFPTFLRMALMADRYLYIPSAGLSLAAGWLWLRLSAVPEAPACLNPGRSWKQLIMNLVLPASAALLILLGVMTFHKNRDFSNDLVFFNRMIKDAPQNPLGYYKLALVHGRRNDFKTMVDLQKVSLQKTIAQEMDLSEGYFSKGLYKQAEVHLRGVEQLGAADDRIYDRLGTACLNQGRVFEAIDYFKRAIALKPASEQYLQNLAKAYDQKQQLNRTFRETGR